MTRPPPITLPEARALAMALMAVDTRPLAHLDAEVRQVLGIKLVADGGKSMRLDLLHDRLTALIHDFPVWHERARKARRRLTRTYARSPRASRKKPDAA